MRQYSIPCIISLLVGALYNIVDQIFIANASYLGSYGNAANTVVFPLTVIALAIAVMIGDGCCAFVSLSLGMGKAESAKRSVGNAVVMTVAASLVLAAAMQGLSLPRPSMILTLLRQAVLPVVIAGLLSLTGWLPSVWISFAAAELVCIPLALRLWRKNWNTLRKTMGNAV